MPIPDVLEYLEPRPVLKPMKRLSPGQLKAIRSAEQDLVPDINPSPDAPISEGMYSPVTGALAGAGIGAGLGAGGGYLAGFGTAGGAAMQLGRDIPADRIRRFAAITALAGAVAGGVTGGAIGASLVKSRNRRLQQYMLQAPKDATMGDIYPWMKEAESMIEPNPVMDTWEGNGHPREPMPQSRGPMPDKIDVKDLKDPVKPSRGPVNGAAARNRINLADTGT